VDTAGQTSQGQPQQQQQGGAQGSNSNGVQPSGSSDPYSYYGQVPTKPPSDFMARTADFGAFGK